MDFKCVVSRELIYYKVLNKLQGAIPTKYIDSKKWNSLIKQFGGKEYPDLLVNIAPLKHILGLNTAGDEVVFLEKLQHLFEKETSLINKVELHGKTLHMFVDHPGFLTSVMPLEAHHDECYHLKGYKIFIDYPEFVDSLSATNFRCYLLGLHLKNLFQMNGATVLRYTGGIEGKFKSEKDPTHTSKTFETNTIGKSEEFLQSFHFEVSMQSRKTSSGIKVLCSPVINKDSNSKSTLNYLSYIELLKDELIKASEHKLPSSSLDFNEGQLNIMVKGCSILHLLSVNHLMALQVEDSKNSSNTRASAFILYNYARLRTLFRYFDNLVAAKVIPPLPSIHSVDFALLKQPEEWELFWLYIHKYPQIMEDIISNLLVENETSKNTSKALHLPTHSIGKFLHSLAHSFAVYYNRVHILPPLNISNEVSSSKYPSHLLPVLWARIFLLKKLLYVYESCFKSLDIVGPDIM